MNKVITIDGPSASGKGTLAILLAERLNWKILDSGALYRAFAYFSISENDNRLIEKNLRKISFNIVDNTIQVLFENEDISRHLRTEETAIQASKISSLLSTREILLPIQRFFSETSNLIADGRDMGSVVFPNANLKFFLDAAPEVRAKRRHLELQKRGQEVNIHDLMTDILERDNKDMRRDISPLRKADDAFTIDSSNLSSEQVLNNAIDEIKKRGLI